MTHSTRVSWEREKANNAEAAEDLRRNREAFINNVKNSMRGGAVRGEAFDKVLPK